MSTIKQFMKMPWGNKAQSATPSLYDILEKMRSDIRIKILEDVKKGDILIAEVDIGQMPKSKAELYINRVYELLDVLKTAIGVKILVIPSQIQISRLFKVETPEQARQVEISFTAKDFMEL